MAGSSIPLKQAALTIVVCDRSRYSYSTPLISQFGLSILIECTYADGRPHRILFDTGWTAGPVIQNLSQLGVRLGEIDSLVLSHAHFDHTGGLAGLLRRPGSEFKIIAHRDIGRPVYGTDGGLHPIGLPPDLLQNIDSRRLRLIDAPLALGPGIYVTGTIPRTSAFEEPEQGVVLWDGRKTEPDPENDDMALVIDFGPKGLLVITGCAHAGPVNTLLAARRITGNHRIGGLVGGLHLIDKSASVCSLTMDAFREMGVEFLWTGHCTGLKPERLLEDAFGDRCRRFYTGDRLVFDASEDQPVDILCDYPDLDN